MDPFTLILILTIAVALTVALTANPKIEDARPKSLGDFNVPTATEDRFVPIVVGTCRLKGPNVVWYDDLKKKPITDSVKVSPFKKKSVVVGFKYFLGIQFGLCRGDDDSPVELHRIWIGDDLAYDGTPVTTDSSISINQPKLFGGDKMGNGGIVGTLAFYTGTSTQPVSSYLAQFQDSGAGTDRTPNYAKSCHAVWERGYLGKSTSIAAWEFELRRIPNGLGLSAGERQYNGVDGESDANPMNFAYEVITNSEWGMRHPAADVNIPAFEDAAATLAAEGNGISMVIDRQIDCGQTLDEIERQIDGKIFVDPSTGLWTVKLIRDDYAVLSVPELTKETNVVTVRKFRRMLWNETSNEVRIHFSDRADEYKNKPAFAQDAANAKMQGDGTVTTGKSVAQALSFPGIKDSELASRIAWRELRKFSYPLISVEIEVTRSLWDVNLGDVVTFSGTIGRVTYDHLPIRVLKINRGTPLKRTMVIEGVQDIFRFTNASYGTVPGSEWSPQVDVLVPFADLLVFEAPRGFLFRDSGFNGAFDDKVWASGVAQSNEVGFFIYSRISPDPYALNGEIFGTFLKGSLTATLARGAAQSASFTVSMASASDKADLLSEWVTGLSPTEVGTNLRHMALIDNEFFLITVMASGSGNDVNMTGVYRGVLDSAQADHASSADVWFLFVSGGLTDNAVTAGATVDVKLLPFSDSDEVLEAAVTAETVVLDDRLRRPIPPGRFILNSVVDDVTSVSLEGTGSGDTLAIDLTLRRRDYRATDETRALAVDAATIFPDFPALNSTEYEVEVRNDPAGANTLLFTLAFDPGPTFLLDRNDILQATGGVLPTTLGVVVNTRHTYETVVYESRYLAPWAFTVASGLTGQFNFGALDQNVTSAVYTATQNGTYAFTVNTAFATGQVEYRLNGGAFTPLIIFPATSGSILGVVATDTIEIRHTSSTSGSQTFLAMDAPSTGQDGYAILHKP